MKRMHPDLFTVLYDVDIAGRRCQMVGNRFLKDIPDKVAVIVHRAYGDGEYARLRREWLSCGERGGVLVGTAIAPREREVMHEAMQLGYRVIWLMEKGFEPLYKPHGRAFDACVEGRLLMVSPWAYHTRHVTISREQCLWLNRMAEAVVGL